jgi:hypothetical protein
LDLARVAWVPLVVGCALLVVVPLAVAQSGGGYDLSWWTVDGGGGAQGGSGPAGAYSLAGTMAQPDAGRLAGGGYTLSGGFWVGSGGAAPEYGIYLPLVVRGYP